MTSLSVAPASERLPWPPLASALAVGFNGLALLLVLAGWYGAAGEARVGDAATWGDLSAAGLALGAVGDAALLVSGRARVGLRQRELARSRSRRLQDAELLEVLVPAVEASVVGLPGQTLRHLQGCPLVAGKPAVPLSERQAQQRDACGWCRS